MYIQYFNNYTFLYFNIYTLIYLSILCINQFRGYLIFKYTLCVDSDGCWNPRGRNCTHMTYDPQIPEGHNCIHSWSPPLSRHHSRLFTRPPLCLLACPPVRLARCSISCRYKCRRETHSENLVDEREASGRRAGSGARLQASTNRAHQKDAPFFVAEMKIII